MKHFQRILGFKKNDNLIGLKDNYWLLTSEGKKIMTSKNDYTCCYCFIALFLLAIALALIYAIFVNVNYLINVQFRLDLVFMTILATVISSLIIGFFGYFMIKSELTKSPKKDSVIMKEHTIMKERSRIIPIHVQREVWRRDEGRCVECGSKEYLEYDHRIPFSKGGSNTVRNIQLLCEKCNRTKSNKI